MADNNLNVSLVIRTIDRATAPLRLITQNFKSFNASVAAANRHFAVAAQLNQAGEAVGRFSKGALSLSKGPLEAFMAFEHAMVRVKAKSEATSSEFDRLTQLAKDLSLEGLFPAAELAAGQEQLAAAGMDAGKIIAALPAVVDFAAASDASLADSAYVVGVALKGFGLAASEARRVTDLLAQANTKSAATFEGLRETFKYAAGDAHQLGISIEQLAGMSMVLSEKGLDGSMAGTSLRTMFVRLAGGGRGPSAQALSELGIQAADAAGNMRPIVDLLSELEVKLGNLGTADREGMLAHIFGVEAVTAANNLLDAARKDRTGVGETMGLRAAIAMASDGAGKTALQVGLTMADTTGSVRKLSSATDALSISLGKQLAPSVVFLADALRSVVVTITKFVDENPLLSQAIVLGVAGFGLLAGVATVAIFAIAGLSSTLGVLAIATGSTKTGVEILGFAIRSATVAVRSLTLATAIPTFLRWGAALRGVARAAWALASTLGGGAIARFVAGNWAGQVGVFGRLGQAANGLAISLRLWLGTALGIVSARSAVLWARFTTWLAPAIALVSARLSLLWTGLATRVGPLLAPLALRVTALATAFWSWLVPALSAAAGAVVKFTIALLASPIFWAVAAVAALAVGAYFLWKNWDTVTATFRSFGPVARGAIDLAILGIGALFGPVGLILAVVGLIIEHWSEIGTFFSWLWDGIKDVFQAGVNWVMALLSPLLKALGIIQDAPASFAAGPWADPQPAFAGAPWAMGPDQAMRASGAPRQTLTAETAGQVVGGKALDGTAHTVVEIRTQPGTSARVASLDARGMDLTVDTGLSMVTP